MVVGEDTSSLPVKTGVDTIAAVHHIGKLGRSRILCRAPCPKVSAYIFIFTIFDNILSAGI